jgi:CrcB protein
MAALLIFIGSGIGGVLRHLFGLLSLSLLGTNFPYGTLLVNIVGSALMGLIIGLFATSNITSFNIASFNISAHDLRLFLTTGLMGGFTTFSAFSLDTVMLWERGQHIAASLYVLLSVIVSIAALSLTLFLVRRYL